MIESETTPIFNAIVVINLTNHLHVVTSYYSLWNYNYINKCISLYYRVKRNKLEKQLVATVW